MQLQKHHRQLFNEIVEKSTEEKIEIFEKEILKIAPLWIRILPDFLKAKYLRLNVQEWIVGDTEDTERSVVVFSLRIGFETEIVNIQLMDE